MELALGTATPFLASADRNPAMTDSLQSTVGMAANVIGSGTTQGGIRRQPENTPAKRAVMLTMFLACLTCILSLTYLLLTFALKAMDHERFAQYLSIVNVTMHKSHKDNE